MSSKKPNKLSKTQIRKLGDRLRKDIYNPTDEDLLHLEEYRSSFKTVIPSIFRRVFELSRQIRHDSITTYRIKRIESILSKLHRFDGTTAEKIELDRMWDIVGCRVIMNSKIKVYQLFELLEKEFDVVLNSKLKCVHIFKHLFILKVGILPYTYVALFLDLGGYPHLCLSWLKTPVLCGVKRPMCRFRTELDLHLN